MTNKTAPGILRFVSMLFLMFKKEMSQKIAPGSLRLVSILFLIFEKGMGKNCIWNFKDVKYALILII